MYEMWNIDSGEVDNMYIEEPHKRKILFIIWSYTYGGGAESRLTNILNNLKTPK